MSARGSCPICGKPRADGFRPFCSKRCADIDLGRWLGGSYAIPATEEAVISTENADDGEGQEHGEPRWTGPSSSSKRPPPRQKPR